MTSRAHKDAIPETGPIPLRHALREATSLGATFRISGATVAINGIPALPQRLQEALQTHHSYLWDLLDDGVDRGPVDLLERLGVKAVPVTTRYAVRQAVRQLIVDLRDHGGPLGLDVETAAKPEYARPRPCIQINKNGCVSDRRPARKAYADPAGTDPHRADIKTAQLYAGGERCFVFRCDALDLLLRSNWLKRQWIVAHNAGFELGFLVKRGYRPLPGRGLRLDCTEQAAGLCLGVGHGGEGRGLANAALQLFGVTVPKDHRLSDWAAAALSEGQIAYAAIDAIYARRIWQRLAPELAAQDLVHAYKLQRNAIPAVVDMHARGLKPDAAEHARQTDRWARDLAAARQRYVELTGHPPPSTDNDVRRWLKDNLDPALLARWKTTPSGQLCVDADHLEQLGHLPTARPILDLRARERLLATFGAKLLEHISPATGRIHASFLIAATKAGRFSCRNPNLQNLPRDAFRQCIVAAEDHTLICADYSQIELRVAAYLYDDTALTEVFASGGDVHAGSAARITGLPASAIDKNQRQQAKAVSFGALYGQGAQGLADSAFARFRVELDLFQAQAALDGFANAYPTLHLGLQHHYRLTRNRGYLRTRSGRMVRAAWEFGRLSYQQSCNLPIQGGAADLMLLAITRVYLAFRKAGICGGLVATVHDELLAEVHRDDALCAQEIMDAAMGEAFTWLFPGAPITGLLEVHSGQNWREAKG